MLNKYGGRMDKVIENTEQIDKTSDWGEAVSDIDISEV